MSGFETRSIHVGQQPDPVTGAVIPPITLSTTFAQDEAGVPRAGYDYARAATPTRTGVEEVLTSLEEARYGYTFASGLAAEDAVLRLISPNAHILIPDNAYGGTFRLVDKVHRPRGLRYTPVNLDDRAAIEAAWQPDTELVLIETPSNPSLAVTDIEAVAAFASERGAISVVDNTFATPYLQRPLGLGADIVVHSATKYLSGHSDVTAGFVATNDAEFGERLYFLQKAVGAVLSPLDCYLLHRGVKTLAVRVERHCDNAEAIAAYLSTHPAVRRILYPGLASHPNHDVAVKQMQRFGGIVSFEVFGGPEVALKVVRSTKIFALAESLGAVESLIEHPGRMTHTSTTGSPLEVNDSLIRLSVGIETIDDLRSDLAQALDQAERRGR